MTAEFAATVAGEIDRVRIAIVQGVIRRLGPLLDDLGVTPGAGLVLTMLRNLPPARSTTRDAVDALFPYQPAETAGQGLAELESAGLVEVAGDHIRLTPAGINTIERLYAELVEVVDEMWHGVDADFEDLDDITGKAIAAAAASGGPTFHVVSPVYAPEAAPAAVRFAENLTPLRFHRFDAHVAAWRNAGLTAEQMQALEAGPVKEAIEAETNSRAAAPYEALDAGEQARLIAGLRSLPTA